MGKNPRIESEPPSEPYIDRPREILDLVRNGLLVVGDDVHIADTVRFEFTRTRRVKIGMKTIVKSGAVIYDGVFISGNVVISHNAVIEQDCSIGLGTFIGHGVVMRPGTKIGNDCKIGHLTVFEGQSEIGHNTLIHAQCHITRGVVIGNDVFLAPFFVGANDPVMAHRRRHIVRYEDKPYRIEDGVRAGIGVKVFPGVTLGRNSLIGMGSLVTTDVPEDAIYFGAPARFRGWVPPKERL